MIRDLRACVDDQSAVLELGEADMRLKRGVLDLAGLISAVNDRVCFGKSLF